MKLQLRLVGSLMAAALALTACGSSDGGDDAGADSASKEGGEAVYLLNNLNIGFDPQNAAILYESQVWAQVTDKLIYLDDKGGLHPWLATSWEVSPDGLEYTLHLKEGVTFTDGTALDATVVAHNIDYWAKGDPDRGIAKLAVFTSNYVSAAAVDPQTVKVTLSAPNLGFLATLGYHASIVLGEATLEADLETRADLSKTVATGPYVVESYKPKQEVVLVKRDDYNWAWEGAKHTGPAYIDKITFSVVPEDILRSEAVASGQATIAHYPPPTEVSALKDEGFQIFAPRYFGSAHGLQLNVSHPLFQDIRVRQAIQHGVNRQELIDTVYTDDWLVATSHLQGNVPETIDLSDKLKFDPELSEELLDEAGWVPGSDGIRAKDGQRLSLEVYPTPYLNTSQLIDELLQQQLKEIGVEVVIKPTDISSYTKQVADPSVPWADQTTSFADVSSIRGWYHSTTQNTFHANDPKLDGLLDQINSSNDFDARKELVAEVQNYIIDQAYQIPLEQLVQLSLVASPDLHDLSFPALARPQFYDAWLSNK